MKKDQNKLNIIDEEGHVTGEETRENIHKLGLLHQEIHVWFYTPSGEIIFQHREKDKDTYPDLLDATVGGHVEIGSDYRDTALKELEEETGVEVIKDNLVFIQMDRNRSYDRITGMTNNVLRAVYAYYYTGKVEDLRVENGKAIGFEAWSFQIIFNITEEDRKRFIPAILEEKMFNIFRKIQKLL